MTWNEAPVKSEKWIINLSSKERQRVLKSLAVFSWSTIYITQQQDLQMAKNREIS